MPFASKGRLQRRAAGDPNPGARTGSPRSTAPSAPLQADDASKPVGAAAFLEARRPSIPQKPRGASARARRTSVGQTAARKRTPPGQQPPLGSRGGSSRAGGAPIARRGASRSGTASSSSRARTVSPRPGGTSPRPGGTSPRLGGGCSPRPGAFPSRGGLVCTNRPGADTALGGESSTAIRVVVRIRPLNSTEVKAGVPHILEASPAGDAVLLTTDGPAGKPVTKAYKYSHCAKETTTQAEFFESSGITPLLDSALVGYAATVFAYGQTGSGKTYTMSGYEDQLLGEDYTGGAATDGILPRAARYIFDQIDAKVKANSTARYTVRASYCEVYNEQVYDLLNLSEDTLSVRWNSGSKNFYVQDLLALECSSLGDLLAVITEGHRNRRIGSTELNKDSSRSHCLLTLTIESETVDEEDGHRQVMYGKVVFVDLAGSERESLSKVEGHARKETRQINLSLLCLGKVISALSSSRSGPRSGSRMASRGTSRKAHTAAVRNAVPPPSRGSTAAPHIPYRDSKLTKLLMDSLGGTALTLMISCVSPNGHNLEDTLNTLNYAQRAGNIKNKPKLQLDENERLLLSLRQQIQHLRMENSFLRGQAAAMLAAVEAGGGNVTLAEAEFEPAGDLEATKPPVASAGSRPEHEAGPQPPEPARRASQDLKLQDMARMLEQYSKEIERLQNELQGCRKAHGASEHAYKTLMVENERLHAKLEQYETLLGSAPSVDAGAGATAGLATPAKPVRQDSRCSTPFLDGGRSETGPLQEMLRSVMKENEELKAKLMTSSKMAAMKLKSSLRNVSSVKELLASNREAFAATRLISVGSGVGLTGSSSRVSVGMDLHRDMSGSAMKPPRSKVSGATHATARSASIEESKDVEEGKEGAILPSGALKRVSMSPHVTKPSPLSPARVSQAALSSPKPNRITGRRASDVRRQELEDDLQELGVRSVSRASSLSSASAARSCASKGTVSSREGDHSVALSDREGEVGGSPAAAPDMNWTHSESESELGAEGSDKSPSRQGTSCEAGSVAADGDDEGDDDDEGNSPCEGGTAGFEPSVEDQDGDPDSTRDEEDGGDGAGGGDDDGEASGYESDEFEAMSPR